jgi:hypothetical protein
MLALRRKTFAGSYSRLMRASRSYFCAPYARRTRPSVPSSSRAFTYVSAVPAADSAPCSARTHARSGGSSSGTGASAMMKAA